jgi:hypothetical protein
MIKSIEKMKKDMVVKDDLVDMVVKDDIVKLRKEIMEEIMDVRQDIKLLENLLQGSDAFRATQKSTVIINFYPPTSTFNNSEACGSVVTLNRKLYVSTAKHVVYDDIKKCIRSISNITDINGKNILFKKEVIIFENEDFDIALIEVTSNFKFPLKVVDLEVDFPEEIFSVSIRNGNFVYQRCMIMEISSTKLITNCGETHGFSGTGYVNYNGELVGIHRGQGPLAHADGDEIQFGEAQWESYVLKCFNVNSFFKKECEEDLKRFLEFIGRNPRCSVIPAFLLRRLLNEGKKVPMGNCTNTTTLSSTISTKTPTSTTT